MADNYATDADVEKVSPLVVGESGISAWGDVHIEAASIIDRDLKARWYRGDALLLGYDPAEYPFDRQYLDLDSAVRLGVYKAIELACAYLTHVSEDYWEITRDYYRDRYYEELEAFIAGGVPYDWDHDGSITSDETPGPAVKSLVRA